MQTKFNVLTGQRQRGLFNVKRSIVNITGVRDFLLSWVVCNWQIGLPVAEGKDIVIFIMQRYASAVYAVVKINGRTAPMPTMTRVAVINWS